MDGVAIGKSLPCILVHNQPLVVALTEDGHAIYHLPTHYFAICTQTFAHHQVGCYLVKPIHTNTRLVIFRVNHRKEKKALEEEIVCLVNMKFKLVVRVIVVVNSHGLP